MATSSLSLGDRLFRARRIGATFGRVYLGIKTNQMIERRLAPRDMPERWARFNRESAERIHGAAVDLRGLILKGCQFLGSRADVLPPEYVEVLSRLQDRVPPRSFRVVRGIVERELGAPLTDVFTSFSERPVASASLAQVHEARLAGGEHVAVKVQYPEIAALVRSDLANLRALFRAVTWVERDFDLMPLVDELSQNVPRELDFEHEALAGERIAAFYADREDVAVPRVHHELSSRRVLVMEYVPGIKISDVAALRAAGVDPTQVMHVLVEAYCEQILVHGFFHADPHPGNLLVQPGKGPDGGPRLVFLDFGLTKELPARFRSQVMAFAIALLRGDADGIGEALIGLGFETRDGRPEALHDIADLLLEVATTLRGRSSLDPEVVRRVGSEIPRHVRENPIVRIPSDLVLVGRVLALLSGLGKTLGAELDLVKVVWPYAQRAAAESAKR